MVAEIKTLKFYEGVPTVAPNQTLPIAGGDATLSNHALMLGQVAAIVAAQALSVTGTDAAPTAVVPANGVLFTGTSLDNLKYLVSDGGADIVSANPQIQAGSFVGQKLRLVFKSAVDTLEFATGNGLLLSDVFISDLDRELHLNYNGTVWAEYFRK